MVVFIEARLQSTKPPNVPLDRYHVRHARGALAQPGGRRITYLSECGTVTLKQSFARF